MSPDPSEHQRDYLDTADAVDRFVRDIASAEVIALDTEGANFYRFVDRIYLLQLSTRERTALIDPLPIGKPASLAGLLADERVEVVIHDADGDMRMIEQDFGWRVTRLFDTRVAAQLLGLPGLGLAALLEQLLGVHLDKKHQRADWSLRPLPEDMLAYAAEDTRHLIDLRDHMRAELERTERWSWAAEEFALLCSTSRLRSDERAPAFLRVKAARELAPRQLAVLRELIAWREGLARAADTALFRVAGDEVLVAVVRAAPQTPAALAAVRGATPWLRDRHGRTLLAAVARGLAVPDDELPHYPVPPRERRDPKIEARIKLLKQVRDAAAARLAIDPTVLAPSARLEAVAKRAPTSVADLQEVPSLRRWQVEVMGDEWIKALAK